MHVLKKLGFGCRGVTAQKDVDFSSESASSAVLELLRDTSEELAEDSLLNVLVLPDAWSERVYQEIVDIWSGGKLFEFSNFSVRECLMIFI